MAFELNKQTLKKLARERGYYSSRLDLNEVLHLQHKGIAKLENLEEFTGVRTLYLECNALDVIEGLDHMKELRCLYLGRNIIHDMVGLETLENLESLDLSSNDIDKIQGISGLPRLKSLNLSENKLRSLSDIEHLAQCPSIQMLDLANNKIDDPEVLPLLQSIKTLSLLRLMGNPVVSATRSYRKTMIAAMPQLNYLDDAPVTEKDRRLSRAFVEGGIEAERAEREALRLEEEERMRRNAMAFDEMVRRAREEAARNPPPPPDPMRFRAVPVGESESEDDSDLPASCRVSRKGRGLKPGAKMPQTNGARASDPVSDEVSGAASEASGSEDEGKEERERKAEEMDEEAAPPALDSSAGAPELVAQIGEAEAGSADPEARPAVQAAVDEGAAAAGKAFDDDYESPFLRVDPGLLGALQAEMAEREAARRRDARQRAVDLAEGRLARRAEAAISQAYSAKAKATKGEGEEEPDSAVAAETDGADPDAGPQPLETRASPPPWSPMVWGTDRYRQLWALAREIERDGGDAEGDGGDAGSALEGEEGGGAEGEAESAGSGSGYESEPYEPYVDPYERYSLRARGGAVEGQTAFMRERQMEEGPAAPPLTQQMEPRHSSEYSSGDVELVGMLGVGGAVDGPLDEEDSMAVVGHGEVAVGLREGAGSVFSVDAESLVAQASSSAGAEEEGGVSPNEERIDFDGLD